MEPYRPKRILVHRESWKDEATREMLARLRDIPVEEIIDLDSRGPSLDRGTPSAKDTLILMHHPGKFLKACQGSGAEICCNYFVVSYAWNCHFECAYCVLQSYLSNEALVVSTNLDDLLSDVRETLASNPERIYRIGSGELADSLALDHITGYSRRLVPYFGRLPNGILELKTKSDQIANLEGLDHRDRTVISWSMNAREICRTEEPKAATFEERLAAAVQCQQWGYRVGFHFDPLVCYPGWEEGYRAAVSEIFTVVDPTRVAWVSLGALRFPPHLREKIRRRFPDSRIPHGEFIPGHHGKVRYFRPIREEMYRKMNSWIASKAPGVFVYLCMESRLVWERSLGESPSDSQKLSDLLDARLFSA